ncbi:MAG: hypothetical protein ACRDQ1_08070, partial [Sciscionella sp.]
DMVDPDAFGLGRDALLAVLTAENVKAAAPLPDGLHRIAPLAGNGMDAPEVDRVCATTLQLPLGALVDVSDVEAIVALLSKAREFATDLSAIVA